jgi:hypothetical protein
MLLATTSYIAYRKWKTTTGERWGMDTLLCCRSDRPINSIELYFKKNSLTVLPYHQSVVLLWGSVATHTIALTKTSHRLAQYLLRAHSYLITMLLPATFLLASFQLALSADETSCQLSGAGAFVPCAVEELVTNAGVSKRLDASLYCPRDSVTQLGFIETTQAELCTCDVDIYDPESPADTGETVDCQCYVCPDGLPQGAAFTCESEIVGSCSSVNCFGECNGDTSIDFLQTGPVTPTANPTATPTATPTQADSAAQNFMFNPSICLAGFAIAGVLR